MLERCVGTSYALLFLSRGIAPIACAKLQFNGQWNARSRDCARFVRWLDKKTERSLNWQVFPADSNPNDWRSPVLFITGQDNHIFKDSNLIAYDRCNAAAPGIHEKHVFANYGHQDTFMGKTCHIDIFPRLLEFLNKHKGRPAQP